MALEISYWTGYDPITRQAYGLNVSKVSYTLTGTSASVGTPPPNATVARIAATEAAIVSNNGSAASATNGVHLAAGEVIDMQVSSPLLAKTE